MISAARHIALCGAVLAGGAGVQAYERDIEVVRLCVSSAEMFMQLSRLSGPRTESAAPLAASVPEIFGEHREDYRVFTIVAGPKAKEAMFGNQDAVGGVLDCLVGSESCEPDRLLHLAVHAQDLLDACAEDYWGE